MTLSPNHPAKLRVGILFGGKSAEHDVSLQSAYNVIRALDANKFTPVLIGINKAGKWHIADSSVRIKSQLQLKAIAEGKEPTSLMPAGDGNSAAWQAMQNIDVVFPVLHGPMGEDGAVQGFLELAHMPYVGPGVLSSAVGMDKDFMKRLLRDAGVPVAPFITVTSIHVDANEIISELGLPLFVKPANMGSSIGVTKVIAADGLSGAIKEALRFDTKVLIEAAIVGDEIECAVLGNESPQASVIGRIVPKDGFYSYEAKYIDESGAVLEIPADIPDEVAEKARRIALKTFAVLGCEGMSRVDMFATHDGEVIVNEINTIPGFTKISMYPKLWEMSGISYTDLITRLIELAGERYERKQALRMES